MDERNVIFAFTYIYLSHAETPGQIATDTISFANIEEVRRNPKSFAFNINISDDKLLLTELKNFEGATLVCLSALKPSMFFAKLDSLASSLNITIKLGYHFMYPYKSLTEIRKVSSIYNDEFLYNKLYREFFENKDISFSMLGPLRSSDMYTKEDSAEDFLVLSTYCRFAAKFDIPILVDVADIEYPAQEIGMLLDSIKGTQPDVAKKCFYFMNYPVRKVEDVTYKGGSVTITKKISNYDEIIGLLAANFNLGLAVENFSSIEELNSFIQDLSPSCLENLLVSPSYRYKTCMGYYGSNSTQIFSEALKHSKTSKAFEVVFVKNPSKLVKEKKKKMVAPVSSNGGFICPICSKQSNAVTNKISKDGLNFCSIDCFRVYLKQPK